MPTVVAYITLLLPLVLLEQGAARLLGSTRSRILYFTRLAGLHTHYDVPPVYTSLYHSASARTTWQFRSYLPALTSRDLTTLSMRMLDRFVLTTTPLHLNDCNTP